uniref:Uncharacterized protein n=1 Tax=Acrobeloides nanus TaxID=290746 RepID=A0A914DIH6_9BILA
MTSNHCNQHRGGSSNAKPKERMIRITFCRFKRPPSTSSHTSSTMTFLLGNEGFIRFDRHIASAQPMR